MERGRCVADSEQNLGLRRHSPVVWIYREWMGPRDWRILRSFMYGRDLDLSGRIVSHRINLHKAQML